MTMQTILPSSVRRASVAALAALVAGACAGGAESGTPGGAGRFLSLGTAGTGGVYYVLGGALASRLSLADEGRQYTAEVTGGSVENVNRVREGQIDFAFVLANTVWEAYFGGSDYPQAVTGMRILAPLYPNTTHVLVGGNTPIQSLSDLRGRRVSVGAAGSGTEQHSRHLLESVGLTYDDVEERFLSFNESAAALADGAIDAAIISVGYPAAAVLEATTTSNARLIAITADEIAALQALYPYYRSTTIPAGLYRGVTEDLSTVGAMNWIISMESLDPSVVRTLLDVLQDDKAALANAHEMGGEIDLNDLMDAPIPLHPAVFEWWQERFGTPLDTAAVATP